VRPRANLHLLCVPVLCCVVVATTTCTHRSTLPYGISDQVFWHLVETCSEPAGTFSLSDNLVSNEPRLPENLRRLGGSGGVYIGVGPEQNFSYIAKLRPRMAFIIDIRRENLNLHLFYKALFELSSDRVDFVSRLFSRPRPPGLVATASVADIFRQYEHIRPSPEQFKTNSLLIRELLLSRGLTLSSTDLEWIDHVFSAFYEDGPDIHFWRSRTADVNAVRPSFRQLITAADATGQRRSFLASEDAFRFVKDLHSRNMIVPIVGDFGGSTAIQRVGQYVRDHGDVVQAFYGSNVNAYLTVQQKKVYCWNLVSLPAARNSAFVESNGVAPLKSKVNACLAGRN
jgi:hypothetical protein